MKVSKAIITIAGKGTRMAPITSAIPKEMLPIGTTPILQFILNEVIASGIKEIMLVISSNRQVVAKYLTGIEEPEDYNVSGKSYSYLNDPSVKLSFAYQEVAKGTADAVNHAKNFTKRSPFALLYGDDLFVGRKPALSYLIDCYNENQIDGVIGVQHINRIQASNYATVETNDFDGKKGIVKSIIEKQDASEITSDLTSVGRYILSSKIYKYIEKIDAHNGEYWITDAINLQAEHDNLYASVIDSVRHDTGCVDGYIRAFKTLC